MREPVNVSVHVKALEKGRVELVLKAIGGAGTWSKVYDGSLFLSMDAQALELLEEVPDAPKRSPKYRLRQVGLIMTEQLEHMRFVKAEY